MKLFDRLCETLTRALGLSALALPWNEGTTSQHPLSDDLGLSVPVIAKEPPVAVETVSAARFRDEDMSHFNPNLPEGPIFKPPNSAENFTCDYSKMKGWKHTAGAGARTQWLERTNSPEHPHGGVFDIWTDYDAFWPTGTTRQYYLNVTDKNINADGVDRPDGGKVFNSMYPGPLIEACWGDTVEVTVENNLRYNGTTVHWHGVRMLRSFEMDGVNAVTQCPIAPGKNFTYKFNVTQYGTSWYHSHYSLQYPDGLAGPLTFHGPSSADYDEALEPFLISDWSHNSAFQDFAHELRKGPKPQMTSVILNGKGFFNCTLQLEKDPKFNISTCDNFKPPIFQQIFQRSRRYLIRLINTSTATTFIFSIDKHMLQIVGMDFVPIEPYYRDSILIGIGQRYHVIVEARPSNDLVPVEDQNYWIRAVVAQGCGDTMVQPNQKIGIIRYNSGNTKTPTTKAFHFPIECSDEPYESLVPIVPRYVDPPANNVTADYYSVEVQHPTINYTTTHGNFSRWDITDSPMWLDFGDPTINHIHDENNSYFQLADKALIAENYGDDDWVYVIISAQNSTLAHANQHRLFVPAAHPIHLHGHDFVLLAQQNRTFHPDDLTNGIFSYNNPPRRDVALLPSAGYIAIGFKTDNPGIWIIHCHIAWHASSGLAVQIRERGPDIRLDPAFVGIKDDVCDGWRAWQGDKTNWWNATGEFQEDSGV